MPPPDAVNVLLEFALSEAGFVSSPRLAPGAPPVDDRMLTL